MSTYKITRFYRDDRPNETIKTGLTLEEAQAHCNDPATRHEVNGEVEWFDGYFTEQSIGDYWWEQRLDDALFEDRLHGPREPGDYLPPDIDIDSLPDEAWQNEEKQS